MKSLTNLKRLSKYFAHFKVDGLECGWICATGEKDATSKLDKLSGAQVLIARPEIRQNAVDSDGRDEYIDSAVFVLGRDLGLGKTDEKENAQYSVLLNIAEVVLDRIREDIDSEGCPPLAGFVLTDVQVVPEALIFGSWCGWSIDLSFRI